MDSIIHQQELLITGRQCQQARDSPRSRAGAHRYEPCDHKGVHIVRWRMVHGW